MNFDRLATDHQSVQMIHCKELQAEEWQVLEVEKRPFTSLSRQSTISLQSIHPTICVSKSETVVKLAIPVELCEESNIEIVPVYHSETAANSIHHSMSVTLAYLPPLLLHISLPPLYPTHAPAVVISARAVSGWVSARLVEEMRRQIMAMWTDMDGSEVDGGGSGILYTLVEWIRTGEFLASLGLSGKDGRIRCVTRTQLHSGRV